jgi:hypothetical protein
MFVLVFGCKYEIYPLASKAAKNKAPFEVTNLRYFTRGFGFKIREVE